MKIYYSIVAGIALMIGCVVSGCRRDYKTQQSTTCNTDSLKIIAHLKTNHKVDYDYLQERNAELKADTSFKYARVIKLYWSKEIEPKVFLKYYVINAPVVSQVFLLETNEDTIVIDPRCCGEYKEDKRVYTNILTGTTAEDLFPELIIKLEYAFKSFGTISCRFGGPQDIRISPTYFLNLQNVEIIKDSNSLATFEKYLNDTTSIVPINWPDTSEVLTINQQLGDTFSGIQKLRIREEAIAEYRSMTIEFYEDIHEFIQQARKAGKQLLPEIKKNYNNANYTYFYQPSDMVVYEIKAQNTMPETYTVKPLIKNRLYHYHFTF